MILIKKSVNLQTSAILHECHSDATKRKIKKGCKKQNKLTVVWKNKEDGYGRQAAQLSIPHHICHDSSKNKDPEYSHGDLVFIFSNYNEFIFFLHCFLPSSGVSGVNEKVPESFQIKLFSS